MDERHLLLLGLLMAQSRHGYEINEFIDRNMGRVSAMKRPTAYALLERMHRRGLINMATETVGNRPPRKVYSITNEGRDAFYSLLRRGLSESDDPASTADIAIMFLDYLTPVEAIHLLAARDQRLVARLVDLEQTPRHTRASGVDFTVERAIALLNAERTWLKSAITKLREKADATTYA